MGAAGGISFSEKSARAMDRIFHDMLSRPTESAVIPAGGVRLEHRRLPPRGMLSLQINIWPLKNARSRISWSSSSSSASGGNYGIRNP